jgi:hypothetical protein
MTGQLSITLQRQVRTVMKTTDTLPAQGSGKLPELPPPQAQVVKRLDRQGEGRGEHWRRQAEPESVGGEGSSGRRLLVHRRGPIAIGILLSLSFFGGLQTLLFLAKNTVATVAPVGPAAVVHPDLASPPITAVVSAPVLPTEQATEALLVGVAGLEGAAPALVQLPAPRPDVDSTDPVQVSPKPIPVTQPPVGTPPAQPSPPIVVPVPEQPLPVPIPPVQIPEVPAQGGTTKPPTSSIPLSTTSPPTSTSTSSHPYPESPPVPTE